MKYQSIISQLEERLTQKKAGSSSAGVDHHGLITKVIVNKDGKKNKEIGMYLNAYIRVRIHV